MKTHWGVEVQLHIFLISTLDVGVCSGSRTDRFPSGKEPPVVRWIGGWVGTSLK